jgi:proteasome accessory factor A
VLDLLARDAAPSLGLADPVAAIRAVSRDPDLKALVPRKAGGTISGLEIQEAYYLASRRTLSGLDEETDWILREWGETLTRLEQDRTRLVGRIDWVTKLWLLETFMQEERIGWNDPWLASLDLEYHNVNPARGLFLGLEAEGKTERIVTDADIEAARSTGPADTRGGIRGLCVRRFGDQIASLQWERIHFKGWGLPETLDMGDLFEPEAVSDLHRLFEESPSPADALKTWRTNKENKP